MDRGGASYAVCSMASTGLVMQRAEYLAQALSRSKPWEARGMSRASWYRRGKPTPAETS